MKMTKLGRSCVWTAALTVLLASPCLTLAGPALDAAPLGAYADYSGWSIAPGTAASLVNPAGNDYLRVEFGASLLPSSELIASDVSAQNYSSGTAILFNFLAEDLVPNSAVVYLHSLISGYTWEYLFTPSAGWGALTVAQLDYTTGWSGGDNNASTFLADLASVDWVGIDIARSIVDGSAQDYGIDNFQITSDPYYGPGGGPGGVPEPGTIVMLATALLSFGALWRWRASAGRMADVSMNSVA